jgi:hypothetical protein
MELHLYPDYNLLFRNGHPLLCPFASHNIREYPGEDAKLSPCGSWCPMFVESSAVEGGDDTYRQVELMCARVEVRHDCAVVDCKPEETEEEHDDDFEFETLQ